MKYSILLIIIIACGGASLRLQQPHIWNTLLTSLQVPETANGSSDSNATTVSAPADATPTQAASDVPTIVTPNSTYVNPDHVKPVEQPAQPPASNPGLPGALPPTPAPATPAAPAPATNAMSNPPS